MCLARFATHVELYFVSPSTSRLQRCDSSMWLEAIHPGAMTIDFCSASMSLYSLAPKPLRPFSMAAVGFSDRSCVQAFSRADLIAPNTCRRQRDVGRLVGALAVELTP